jgi:uncharacterized small protein (TIGR04563 family)
MSTKKVNGTKTSVYLRTEVLKEMRAESDRQGRSISWLVTQSWIRARDTIKSYPGIDDFAGDLIQPKPKTTTLNDAVDEIIEEL